MVSKRFRKKPVVIEAFNFYLDPMPDWFMDKVTSYEIILHDCGESVEHKEPSCKIKTLEGDIIARPGDWIIKGTQGEIYPCKDYVFQKIYEEVKEREGD